MTKKDRSDHKRKPYVKPVLQKLGNMARVTQKTGGNPDQQRVFKPGMGGG